MRVVLSVGSMPDGCHLIDSPAKLAQMRTLLDIEKTNFATYA